MGLPGDPEARAGRWDDLSGLSVFAVGLRGGRSVGLGLPSGGVCEAL